MIKLPLCPLYCCKCEYLCIQESHLYSYSRVLDWEMISTTLLIIWQDLRNLSPKGPKLLQDLLKILKISKEVNRIQKGFKETQIFFWPSLEENALTEIQTGVLEFTSKTCWPLHWGIQLRLKITESVLLLCSGSTLE